MTDPLLQTHIVAVMFVSTYLIIFWAHFRKLLPLKPVNKNVADKTQYNRLKRISMWYWVIFSLFGVMTVVYSYFPELYYIFLPLDFFHHPVINAIGLLILKISIVWIVIAQLHIDKELYKYSRNIKSLSAMELVNYSERMLLSGMLVLFIGYLTTITNIVGFLLVIAGVAIYFKMFLRKLSDQYS